MRNMGVLLAHNMRYRKERTKVNKICFLAKTSVSQAGFQQNTQNEEHNNLEIGIPSFFETEFRV